MHWPHPVWQIGRVWVLTGEILLDLVGRNQPTDEVVQYQGRLGGSALNTAVVLRQLHQPVRFVGNLGSGPVGQWALSQLEQRGMDTRFLLPLPVANPLSLAEVDAEGNARYSFYRQWGDLPFGPDPAVMEGASWFHFGSLSAFHPRNLAGILRLLQAAGQQDAAVSFDPNLRAGLPPGYIEQLQVYLPQISLLKCSLEDAQCWFPACSVEQALAQLTAWGVPLVVLTLGEQGVVAAWKGHLAKVPARQVKVVDTIGAGDTFTAALLYGLQQLGLSQRTALLAWDGGGLERVLAAAVDLAAEVCTTQGAGLGQQQVDRWQGQWWPDL